MARRLRLHLSVDGLAGTRLAYSPLLETVFSLRTLAAPDTSPVHRPWALAVRSRLDGIDLDTLLALSTPAHPAPDFLTPPPPPGRRTVVDELDLVRSTPPERIRRDLRRTYGDVLPQALEPIYRKPGNGLDMLVRLLHAYWERALADHWPCLRHVLEGDIVYRTRRIASRGTVALFHDLHEQVVWEDGVVSVGAGDGPDHRVAVAADGLLLVPSAFAGPSVAPLLEPSRLPVIVYPTRGAGTLWQVGGSSGPAPLAALIGRTRAGLLALLDAPVSTSELARRGGLSVGSASRQLAVLRAAGLVESHRRGHAIVHVSTTLGRSLLDGDDSAGTAAAG